MRSHILSMGDFWTYTNTVTSTVIATSTRADTVIVSVRQFGVSRVMHIVFSMQYTVCSILFTVCCTPYTVYLIIFRV